MLKSIVLTAGLTLLSTAAFAADAAPMDMTPFFNTVVWPALSVVALALAGWIAKKITDHTTVIDQDKARTLVNAILQSGLQMAQARAATSNIEHPAVQEGILRDALGYATTNGPEALKRLGIDVTTDAGRAQIADKLESMLAPAIMIAASSQSDVSVATAATIVNPAVPTGPAVNDPPAAVIPAAAPASIAQVTADAKPPIDIAQDKNLG